MFSNDQNIERIADFVEEVKRWLELKADYARLDIVDKVVRIITALVLSVVLFVIMILALTYFSFATAIEIGALLDSLPLGYLIMSAVYLVLFFIVISARHALIERPLVKFLVSILAEEKEDEQ